MTRLLIMLISTVSILQAQTADHFHIWKSYPYWRMNFEKHSIDLSELISGGPPKDGIPAIMRPKFVSSADAAEFLSEKESVIFLQIGDDTKAYPLQILIWHEIED